MRLVNLFAVSLLALASCQEGGRNQLGSTAQAASLCTDTCDPTEAAVWDEHGTTAPLWDRHETRVALILFQSPNEGYVRAFGVDVTLNMVMWIFDVPIADETNFLEVNLAAWHTIDNDLSGNVRWGILGSDKHPPPPPPDPVGFPGIVSPETLHAVKSAAHGIQSESTQLADGF